MKKAFSRLLSVLLVAALLCTVLPVALATDEAGTTVTLVITPSVNPAKTGTTVTLTASVTGNPEGATVTNESYTWTGATGSSSSATVTSNTAGEVEVSCTYTATYTIPAPDPAEGEEAGEPITGTLTGSTSITVTFQDAIELSQSSVSIAVGGTATVTATTYPSNAVATWTSLDSSVATVDNGTITGVKAGSTTVTASFMSNGDMISASCDVTVTDKLEIATQPVSAAYNTGATSVQPLTVALKDTDTTGVTYTWYRYGYKGAYATGTSCTPDVSKAGTYSYYCVVSRGEDSVTSSYATITVRDEYTVAISEYTSSTSGTGKVSVGGSLTLYGTVTQNIPSGASFTTKTVSSNTLVWSSADASKVRVNNSYYSSKNSSTGSYCTVYGVASSIYGTDVTAQFTAPSSANLPGKTYSASYTIKVQDQIEVTFTKNPATVLLGSTSTDTVVASVVDKSANRTCTLNSRNSYYASGYTYTVTYATANSYIASIDSTGVVTGRTKGETTITATVLVYYNGTLVAEVTESCPVTVYEGGVEYYVANGSSVDFDEDDFNAFFQKSYPRYTLSYVVFNMDSATNCNSSAYGYLYYNSGSSSYKTYVTGSRTAFYYNASSNQYDLDALTYVTGTRTGSYTVTIPFTAYGYTGLYSTQTQTVSGCVTINVNSGHSITYLGTSFRTAKIASEITQAYPGAAYVQFAAPDSDEGQLFYNYTTIAKYDHAVTAKNTYYLNATSKQYAVENVYFVPAATVTSGSGVTLTYTAYNAYGNSLGTGKIFFTVSGQTSSNYFNDVTTKNTGSWSANAIDFLYYNGLVSGTGTRTFSPTQTMTRGMLVTMLYNAAGQPSVSGYNNPFKDVSTKDYYYNAVIWAYRTGVVYGTSSTTFSPNASVTREQIASFLYRYANGSSTYSYNYSLNGYTDSNSISSYALPAMRWAVQNGYISGYNKQLNPTGNATRAEVSSMLHRFLTA